MTEYRIGDLVWVEINGAILFPKPVPIEQIHEDKGVKWFCVEGSTTGLTADNLTLVRPGTKPKTFQGDLRNLPDALALLKEKRNWVCWKWESRLDKRKGTGKWTKPPLRPGDPTRYAKNNDPSTWGSYDEALAAYEAGLCDGIGFCFPGTNIAAFDIDKCRDPATGKIAPEAMAIVDRTTSYTEITPSGTGLRVIGTSSGGKVHRKQKIPGSAVEIESYRGAERYITITGNPLPRTWPHVADIGNTFDAVVAELDGKDNAGQGELAPAPNTNAGKDDSAEADPGNAPAAEAQATPVDGDPFGLGDAFLPGDLVQLVANGVPPEEDLSAAFHHAVCWLGDCGWSAERIESYIAGKSIVPERFIKRLGKEIARCLKKRRANPGTGAALPGASTPPPAGKSEPDESTLGGFDTTADWTRPEGLLGKMADFIMLTSRRPNRPLAVASAVTVLSAACGRHLYGPTGTALNVYVVALAGTATGKDRPLAAPGVILKAAGFERLHTTAKAFSVSAFEQMMIDYPCCVATVDEIGASLFARMSHKHSSTHEQGIRGVLLELWSRDQFKGPFSTTRHARQRGAPKVAGTVAIPWPNLTLLGVSTPEAFYAAVTTGSVRDGFLNRFLLCLAAPRGKAQEVAEESGKVPQDIVDALYNLVPRLGLVVPKSISDLDAPLEDVIRRLPWADDDARERAQQLEEQILAKIDGDPETAPLWGRVFEYAVRLASLHAVSRAGPHATVTLDDLAWGTAWASQSARTMIEGVRNLMASNEYEAKFNLIRNIVREADQITRTTLLRSVRSISARDRDDVIRHLIEAGLIEEFQIASKGRTAKGWRWLG